MPRVLIKWLSTAMVVPLLVLAVSAPALAMQCRALGVTMSSCCCPKAKVPAAAVDTTASTSSVGRQSCCFLEREAALPGGEISLSSPGPRADEAPVAPAAASSSALEGLDLRVRQRPWLADQ